MYRIDCIDVLDVFVIVFLHLHVLGEGAEQGAVRFQTSGLVCQSSIHHFCMRVLIYSQDEIGKCHSCRRYSSRQIRMATVLGTKVFIQNGSDVENLRQHLPVPSF